ncbi:hypothetical protein Tco_0576036 [Tanacetum coccineum]
MKIVVAFSLLRASPFFADFACSPHFPPCFISLTKCDSCPDLTSAVFYPCQSLRWSALDVLWPFSLRETTELVFCSDLLSKLGMLSFNFLIKSGLVIPCMNPDILMHSDAYDYTPANVRPATFAVSGILFFFNFCLAFTEKWRSFEEFSSLFFPFHLLLLRFSADLVDAPLSTSHACDWCGVQPYRHVVVRLTNFREARCRGGESGVCCQWNDTQSCTQFLADLWDSLQSCGTRVPCGACAPCGAAKLMFLSGLGLF